MVAQPCMHSGSHMGQEWVQSYHYLSPLTKDQEAHFEDESIIVGCSCREFYQYFRCIHVLVYALGRKGHGIVPHSEDIRRVSTKAARGRPLLSPDRYGQPHSESNGRRRRLNPVD